MSHSLTESKVGRLMFPIETGLRQAEGELSSMPKTALQLRCDLRPGPSKVKLKDSGETARKAQSIH